MQAARSPTRVVVLRILLYGLALVVSIGTSIMLTRRLSAADYAAYQFATKRIIQYATAPLAFFGLWMYRYLAVRRRGSLEASLVLVVLTMALGMAIATVLEHYEARLGLATSLAAGFAILAQGFMLGLSTPLDAVRPVRNALSTLIYRMIYFAALVVALYLLEPSMVTVFVATGLAMAVVGIMEYEWLVGAVGRSSLKDGIEVLEEWARTSAPLAISYVAGFVASLDVSLAYPLMGYQVVAVFFVATAIVTLVREAANTGLRYLQLYTIRTGGYAQAVRSLGFVFVLVVPFLAYLVVYPRYVVYVYNPVYAWASEVVAIFLVTAIVEVLNAGVANIVLGTVRDVGPESVNRMTRIASVTSASSLVYIGLLVGLAIALRGLGPVALAYGWAFAYMARYLTSVATNYYLLNRDARAELRRSAAREMAPYTALAFALAFVIRPWFPPAKELIDAVIVLLEPGALFLIVYYLVVFLTNARFRRYADALLQQLSKSLGQ